MAADGLLLGRKTYEGFAEAWPSREGELADKFNTMPKDVVSTTIGRAGHGRTRASSATWTAVRALKETQEGTLRRPWERASSCSG